jgi:hypothetical protein
MLCSGCDKHLLLPLERSLRSRPKLIIAADLLLNYTAITSNHMKRKGKHRGFRCIDAATSGQLTWYRITTLMTRL